MCVIVVPRSGRFVCVHLSPLLFLCMQSEKAYELLNKYNSSNFPPSGKTYGAVIRCVCALPFRIAHDMSRSSAPLLAKGICFSDMA
jgi:hypothetical protein